MPWVSFFLRWWLMQWNSRLILHTIICGIMVTMWYPIYGWKAAAFGIPAYCLGIGIGLLINRVFPKKKE